MSSARRSKLDSLAALAKERLKDRRVKYVAAGIANTGSTYLLYLLLLVFMDYKLAYSITYVAGIALAYFLNSRVVFKAKHHVLRMILYPAVYVIQYLVNAGLLILLVSALGMPQSIAPIVVIAVSFPVGYLLNKIVLTFEPRKGGGDEPA